MKNLIFVLDILGFLSLNGCQNLCPCVTDIQLGMQVFEIENLSHQKLIPVASQTGSDGKDLVQYRIWTSSHPNVKKMLNRCAIPYLLTFEIYPPLDKEKCSLLVKKMNVSEPNDVSEIMALEGYRPTRLIQMKPDDNTLLRQTIIKAAIISTPSTPNTPSRIVPDGMGGYSVY